MKKTRIIFLIILIIFIAGCSNDNLKKDEKSSDKIKSLSTEYEHFSFVCDAISDASFVIIDSKLFVNRNIYDVVLSENEKYSNEQQCKIISNVMADKLVIINGSAYGSVFVLNNNAYRIVNEELVKSKEYTHMDVIAVKDGVISISLASYEYKNNLNYYVLYALNEDGNIYEYTVTSDNIGNDSIVSKGKIVYSSNDYGKIKYFYYSATNDKRIENIVIFSENGLFQLSEVETSECKAYVDVECEKKMIKNKKIDSYLAEILYFDIFYIIDKDNNLYSNNFVKIEYIP